MFCDIERALHNAVVVSDGFCFQKTQYNEFCPLKGTVSDQI